MYVCVYIEQNNVKYGGWPQEVDLESDLIWTGNLGGNI